MLWMTAWEQTPCGSLPDDDELIAARIGMPVEQFQAARKRLMRGWWIADDGRLYHDTLAERVLEMIERRDGERNRKAEYRARKQAERDAGIQEQGANSPAPSPVCPDLSHGTPSRVPRDSAGSDATGTGTGTSKTKEIAAAAIHPHARDPVDTSPPPSEALWLAAQKNCAAGYAKLLNGLEQVRGKRSKFVSTDARLIAWERLGLTRAKLVEAYHLAVAERNATEDASPVNAGFLDVFVTKVLNPPEGESIAGKAGTGAKGADPLAWATSWPGIVRRGADLGVTQEPGELDPYFKARVMAAAGLTDADRDRLRADFGVCA